MQNRSVGSWGVDKYEVSWIETKTWENVEHCPKEMSRNDKIGEIGKHINIFSARVKNAWRSSGIRSNSLSASAAATVGKPTS
jgi:hypothetical protein